MTRLTCAICTVVSPKSIQLDRSPVAFDPSSTACVIKSAPETPMRSEGSPIGSVRPIRAPPLRSKPNPGVNSPGSATSLTPILHTLTITAGGTARSATNSRIFVVEVADPSRWVHRKFWVRGGQRGCTSHANPSRV